MQYELYPLIGIMAGFLAGLLGIGGGIIIVPLLSLVLYYTAGIPENIALHFALGTAAAVVLINCLINFSTRQRHGKINWQLFKRFLPGLLAGAGLGVVLADVLNGRVLAFIVSVFLLLVAYWSFKNANPSPEQPSSSPAEAKAFVSSFGIALISCMVGSSGTSFTIPYFMRLNLPLQEAIGTALPCALPLTMMTTVGFIGSGTATTTAYWSTGFIYWPALLGILTTSLVFTRVGATLTHSISAQWLQRGLAIILLLLGFKMFFTGVSPLMIGLNF